MITSPTISLLAKALKDFQADVPKIAKNSTNPFFHSKYASLDDIISAVRAPLAKHGLVVSQIPCGDNRLLTLLIHEQGEYIGDEASTCPAKNDPQGAGSAITYMRRYALSAILGIAAEDDDDGNVANNNHQPHYEPVKATTSPVATSNGMGRPCQSCGANYVPKPGTESFSTICISCYKKSKSAPKPVSIPIPNPNAEYEGDSVNALDF